jgi:glutathione reductase (NADPH)
MSASPTTAATTAARKYMFDLLVVGGGSGGVRCARMSAGHGAKVGLIETSLKHGPPHYTAIGGTCVNVGCVPKKLFVYASHFHSDFESSEGYGWNKPKQAMEHDWNRLIQQKDKEITRLNGAYSKILSNASKEGVKVFEGFGSLLDPHTIKFTSTSTGEESQMTAENIVISVGGWPLVPKIPGSEYTITSNEAFYLKTRPERLLIVGGGYIACEFACIFQGLGTKVTQMYRGSLILRGFDDDIRRFIQEEIKKKGVDVQLESNPNKIEQLPSGVLRVTTENGIVGEYDAVMYAVGRVPKLEGLGLDKLGVKIGSKGEVLVNEWSRTNIPSIYAIGDCTDRVQLTPVALREGHYLADALFSNKKRSVVYDIVPSAVFTQPQIGTVGLTEKEAVEKFRNVSVYTSTYKAMKHTMTESKERCYMKVLVDDNTNRVVGVHVVDDNAAEIVQGFGVALTAGATKQHFDDTLGIHPTSAEELCTMRTVAYSYREGSKI